MNKLLTVLPPDSDGKVRLGNGTQVLFGGEEVGGVQRLVLTLGVDEVVTAEVTLALGRIKKIEAHPLLSIATLEEAAKHYGLALIDQKDVDKIERLLTAVRNFDVEPEPEVEPVVDPLESHRRRVL